MKPTLVVAGLGRCGTSMVMQMLHRGGFPCVGAWPAFEVHAARDRLSAEFVSSCAGEALKVLDPHRVGLPGNVRVIWMDRDLGEQAKSQIKFASFMHSGVRGDRDARRRMAVALRRDTTLALSTIGQRPLVRLSFEEVLEKPRTAALLLAEFARMPDFDIEAAVRAIRSRSPACAPELDLEMSLLDAISASAPAEPAGAPHAS